MSTDPRSAIRALRGLAPAVQGAAGAALTAATARLEAELQATDAHGDVTGATRASYRVYVVSETDDGSTAAADGAAAAEALNPGRSVIVRQGEIGDDVVVVATGFTDYLDLIATESGGAKDAVTALLPAAGPSLAQTVAGAIARRLGS